MLAHLVLLAVTAGAEEPTFVGAAAAEEPPAAPVSLLSAELGGAWASGNIDNYAINGRMDGSHKRDSNKFSLGAGINVGKAVVDVNADGFLDATERAIGQVETARRYSLDVRYDRFLSEKDSLYALAGGLVDPFAGYDNRVHGQLGYSRILVATDKTGLRGELGVDVAREDFVTGITPGDAIVVAAHALGAFTYNFNESVTFTDTFEVFENVQDTDDLRLLNQAAITSKLSDVFSLRVSHQLGFDNVPVDGFLKLDQTTMATFVASLL